MAGCEIRVFRAIEVVGCDDRVVCPDIEHVLSRLRRTTVDREGIIWTIDRAPIGNVALEAGFDLPVLD
jgi:hypothetical protein